MKVGVFSCKAYDREFFNVRNNNFGFDLEFLDCSLNNETVELAKPFDAVSVFVNDVIDELVLNSLQSFDIHHIALRCAGFNNIDLEHARKLGIGVSRVPSYSAESDVISLHCPFNADTQHMIDHAAIQNMKDKVMIINTSRGGLVNTQAIVTGLKSEKIGYLGIDIYEMESELENNDLICESITDDTYQRLATFPNVLITAHQGFFTSESLQQIVNTTLKNLQYYFAGKICNETFLL
jgi:lactate dehydrogenase-like 2-hydroxyacid dehydrogenase